MKAKEECCYHTRIGNKQTQILRASPAACGFMFVFGRADFDFFVGFENTSELQIIDMHAWLSPTLSALLRLTRSDRNVLGLLLCAGLIGLCCAVVGAPRQRATP